MLHGGDFPCAMLQNRTTLGGCDIVGYGLVGRMTLKVSAADTDTCVLLRREKSGMQVQASMQTLALKREGGVECMLFHCFIAFVLQ